MADDTPAADAEFHAWRQSFVAVANANLAGLGLVAGDLTPITGAQTTWGTAHPGHVGPSPRSHLPAFPRPARPRIPVTPCHLATLLPCSSHNQHAQLDRARLRTLRMLAI
jgi:hypothetical protein